MATEQEVTENTNNTILQPDDLNFPKLPSSAQKTDKRDGHPGSHKQTSATETPRFVWRNLQTPEAQDQDPPRAGGDKGKGKQVNRTPDSAPITRQGYRSGRLADDFWAALATPHTPGTQRKTLRVTPILIKEKKDEALEYLVSSKLKAPKYIAQVHIGELLAGVPWTEARVRQHVVNEVAQALYKVFVFTNPASNPLQKWRQGKWFADWTGELDGDYVCNLYVCVLVQENKIKPRKGHTYGWNKIPQDIRERIQMHTSEAIEAVQEEQAHWIKMIHEEASCNQSGSEATKTHQNRFAVLSEETTPI